MFLNLTKSVNKPPKFDQALSYTHFNNKLINNVLILNNHKFTFNTFGEFLSMDVTNYIYLEKILKSKLITANLKSKV